MVSFHLFTQRAVEVRLFFSVVYRLRCVRKNLHFAKFKKLFIYGTFDLQKHFVVTCLFTILLLQLVNDMHNIFAGMFYYYFDFDATHNTYDFTDEEFFFSSTCS